jgi:hypothetical protein
LVERSEATMNWYTIRGRGWQRLGTVIAALVPLVFVIAVPVRKVHGFAFTPRWSAVFAAWALLTITLILDWLVRWQADRSVDKTVQAAGTQAKATRDAAGDMADAARAAGGTAAANPDAQAAGKMAVSATAEHTAALVRARRAGLKSLVVGIDGRASTSKLQAVLWTYAVLFTLVYMIVLGRRLLGGVHTPGVHQYGDAMKHFLDAGFRPEYIALLGLPIAGAVAAKGIISGKVVNEQLLKAPASDQPGVGRGLAEVVCGDTGQTDLLDFQYAAFNLVALLYFFISFATTSAIDPSKGMPTIPPTLLSLAGVSTLAYLAKKQLETGLAPVITSVTPMRVLLGTDPEIQITGDGFYAQGKAVNTMFNQVLLDGHPLPTDKWERTSVTALLPTGLDRSALEALEWKENPAAELVVRDDSATSSPAVKLDVRLPAPGAPPAAAPAPAAAAAVAPPAAPAPGVAPPAPASLLSRLARAFHRPSQPA